MGKVGQRLIRKCVQPSGQRIVLGEPNSQFPHFLG